VVLQTSPILVKEWNGKKKKVENVVRGRIVFNGVGRYRLAEKRARDWDKHRVN